MFVFLRDWERVDKQKNIVVEVLPVGGTVADRSLKAALRDSPAGKRKL